MWSWKNADLLNAYQTETRYGEDIASSRREVRELYELAKEYMMEIKRALEVGKVDEQLKPSSLFEK